MKLNFFCITNSDMGYMRVREERITWVPRHFPPSFFFSLSLFKDPFFYPPKLLAPGEGVMWKYLFHQHGEVVWNLPISPLFILLLRKSGDLHNCIQHYRGNYTAPTI